MGFYRMFVWGRKIFRVRVKVQCLGLRVYCKVLLTGSYG